MIAPGLQRRLRVLSAWGYLVVQRLCLLCFFCFFGSWVVAWCVWWFERADFVSPVMSSPTRPACCATDVVKRRQSKKKTKPRVSAAYYVCTTNSRLSSHGSSTCPQRTTFVLQKSTFRPQKLRVSAAYYVCSTKVDFPATEAPGASVAYYICTTKVDFPATEAPRVRGVLRLYYKSRLSTYYFCATKVDFPATEVSAAYYVCTTKVDFPATEAPGASVAYYICTTKSTFQPRKLRVSAARSLMISSHLWRQGHGSASGFTCLGLGKVASCCQQQLVEFRGATV